MKKNNLTKSFIWNTLGSGFVSFNSLFFMIAATRINGLSDAGIFTLCFATSCLFYTIAIYSGRTYQVTEIDDNITDNNYIYNRIISCLIMIFVSIVFGMISKYFFKKFLVLIILCIVKAVEALCDVFHGILQKHDRLDIVGKSLLIRSVLQILIFIIVDMFTKNLIFSSLSLILTTIIILLCVDIPISLKYKVNEKNTKFDAIFKIFYYGFFTFAFTLIANYIVNAPRYSIDALLDTEFQTIFGIIAMPATIILLINQFFLQPIIVKLKKNYLSENKAEFLKLVYKLIFITIITGISSIILAYIFGIQVLKILYNINLSSYLKNLLIILFGATLYSIASVFSNSLIVLRKTKIQLVIYIITAVFALVSSYLLIYFFKFNGATWCYLMTTMLLLFMYGLYFMYVVKKEATWKIRNGDKFYEGKNKKCN